MSPLWTRIQRGLCPDWKRRHRWATRCVAIPRQDLPCGYPTRHPRGAASPISPIQRKMVSRQALNARQGSFIHDWLYKHMYMFSLSNPGMSCCLLRTNTCAEACSWSVSNSIRDATGHPRGPSQEEERLAKGQEPQTTALEETRTWKTTWWWA